MLTVDDPIELTAALVRRDTSRGQEDRCTIPLARALADAGLDVELSESAPGRSNLLASWRSGAGIVLAAHADTVPFAAERWRRDPLCGEVVDGRIHGRGTSDMKGGLAAMVCAAAQAAREGASPFSLLITIGEETGCRGAADMLPVLERRAKAWSTRGSSESGETAGPVFVIGESTANELRYGHKGASWLRLSTEGRSAHGSRPELGENAILELARAISDLDDAFSFPEHAYLGAATSNVGTIAGGLQANIVPDAASADLDIRTVPGVTRDDVLRLLSSIAPGASIEPILDLPPVWADPSSRLSGRLQRIVDRVSGAGEPRPPRGVSYFTDAAVLTGIPAAEAYVCGPGDPEQPHSVDESCSVERIHEARQIYRAMIDADLPRSAETAGEGGGTA